jgi:hypothetical protein
VESGIQKVAWSTADDDMLHRFNFKPPQGLDEQQMPVYSGKVLVRSSFGEELSVPYMG